MQQPNQITDVSHVLENADAGVLEQKIAKALSDVALGVVEYSKKGQVKLTFDISHIKDTKQVSINHTIYFDQPTKNGKDTTTDTTSTPFYVGGRGKLTLMPDNQIGFDFEAKQAKEEA